MPVWRPQEDNITFLQKQKIKQVIQSITNYKRRRDKQTEKVNKKGAKKRKERGSVCEQEDVLARRVKTSPEAVLYW